MMRGGIVGFTFVCGVSSVGTASEDGPAVSLPRVFEPSPPEAFAASLRKPDVAIVLATVGRIDRGWTQRGLNRQVVAERYELLLDSIAWQGDRFRSIEEPAKGASLEVVLRGEGSTTRPPPACALATGGWYWLAIAPEPDSTSYTLLSACEAAPPRFEVERHLACYRSHDGFALVIARLSRIEQPAAPVGWFGRFVHPDFDRAFFDIERVVWNRSVFASAMTERSFVAKVREGPLRSDPVEDRRYWLVLRDESQGAEASLVAAIEIPTLRDERPLDLFERFRNDHDHALFVGRIAASSRATRQHVLSIAHFESLRIEVMALPWGDERPGPIRLMIGAFAEIENAPTREDPEAPPMGTLAVGSTFLICVAKPSDSPLPRVVAVVSLRDP